MTTDTSLPSQPIPATGDDAATGTDKAMKQFSRTDAERERERTAEGTIASEAQKDAAKADRPAVDSTQPPPSTAPATPAGKA